MYVLQYTLGTSFVHITWIIHKKLFMRRNKDGKYFMQKWHKNPLFGSILFSNPLQPYLRPNIVQMTIIISHSTVHCWLRCPIRILKLKKKSRSIFWTSIIFPNRETAMLSTLLSPRLELHRHCCLSSLTVSRAAQCVSVLIKIAIIIIPDKTIKWKWLKAPAPPE